MKRNLAVFALTVAAGLGLTSMAHAQVWVRAPFVRVGVGPGVYVRAPFVNLWLPPAPIVIGPRYYVNPPVIVAPAPGYATPGPGYVAPMPRVVESPPPPSPEPQPSPNPAPNLDATPLPAAKTGKAQTLEEFAKTFQPKGGSFEVNLVSPVTNLATLVRFSLPDGAPRRVHVRNNEVEFDYGIRRFVRIEFDNEGAVVTSR